MKIQSNYNTKIILDKIITFKKGDIIEGEILKLGEENITIKLNDGKILNAKLDGAIVFDEGDVISLNVKENTRNAIIMSLIKSDDNIASNNTNYTKSFDITSLINKTMIKYDLEPNKDTFNKLFNYINKITNILNIPEEQVLYSENNINTVDISKIINKNIDELNVSNYELSKLIDETNVYKSEIYKIFTSKEKMLERITFLFSNNIDVSFKNIKLTHRFESDNDFLFEEIGDLMKEFDNENGLNKKFSSLINNKEVNKLKRELVSVLKSIYDNIDEIKSDKNKLESLEVFHTKLKFLEKLISNFFINFIPINISNKENLLIVKNKNKDNKELYDDISFKIATNTNNLGLINIFCKLSHNNLNIDIKVETNNAHSLIKDNINLLSVYLQSEGFTNNIRVYKDDTKKSLELFTGSNSLDFSLDLKV